VVLEHYLAKRSRGYCQNNYNQFQKHVLYRILQENFLNFEFCNFWAQFDSFDVSDSCHVILIHYLSRRSHDNCQNNSHNSQKHVLYRILQENFSKLLFAIFEYSMTVLTLVAVVTWLLDHYLARRSRDNCQNKCNKPQKHVFYWILQE